MFSVLSGSLLFFGCDGRTLLHEGPVVPICATQDGRLLVAYDGVLQVSVVINAETGVRTDFWGDRVHCEESSVGADRWTAAYYSDPQGVWELPGVGQAWRMSPDERWALGVGFVGPPVSRPYRLREYARDAQTFTEVVSWCFPWAVYTGSRGVSPICPDPTTLEVIVWTPGALEHRTSRPVQQFAEGDLPDPILRFGQAGTRAALFDVGGAVWDVPLEGGAVAPLSGSVRWAELTSDEQHLLLVNRDGTLQRHPPGAAAPVTVATGVVSQQEPGQHSNIAEDYVRDSRTGTVAAYHVGPELQLNIIRLTEPFTEQPVALGGTQRGPWTSFTDNGRFVLYRLGEDTLAQPTAGGPAVLIDSQVVEIFGAQDSVVAWTNVLRQLKVVDLDSASKPRVLEENVVPGGRYGPIRVGERKLAYIISSTGDGGAGSDSLYVRNLR